VRQAFFFGEFHMTRRHLTSRLWAGALTVFVALGAMPVRAADSAWSEMIDMFAAACLGKFPDDNAVRQLAADKRFAVMPDNMVHQLLGTDPGQGWLQDTARGRYLLTIEMPPFHTCAIRKTDTAAPDFLAPFSLLIGTWAATQSGASLKALPPQNAKVEGYPTEVHQWVVDRGPGKPTETLMMFVTNVDNKVAARLVRQIRVQ
jgi:hypothetical protein